jgi:hypothetical protein
MTIFPDPRPLYESQQCCANCHWWRKGPPAGMHVYAVAYGSRDTTGVCMEGPPDTEPRCGGTEGNWPETSADRWCGRWLDRRERMTP